MGDDEPQDGSLSGLDIAMGVAIGISLALAIFFSI